MFQPFNRPTLHPSSLHLVNLDLFFGSDLFVSGPFLGSYGPVMVVLFSLFTYLWSFGIFKTSSHFNFNVLDLPSRPG